MVGRLYGEPSNGTVSENVYFQMPTWVLQGVGGFLIAIVASVAGAIIDCDSARHVPPTAKPHVSVHVEDSSGAIVVVGDNNEIRISCLDPEG